MMFKRILPIICLIICLFAMASVCANDTAMASENSLEIDHTTDDLIGDKDCNILSFPETNDILTDDEQTFAQLNVTINGNANKDIYLNSDYKYSDGDDSFKKGIVIDRDVNIYGNGHTINGSNQARIFNITGGNVVFYNLTFVNANAGVNFQDKGGAVYGNCTAINCTFKENHGFSGGVMYGGSAVNCTFSGNSANYLGGVMYEGSAVNCVFTGNSAFGGGAMCSGSALNCVFTGNSGEYGGGAMFGVSAVNCVFSNNYAGDFGGAMNGGSAVNCTFSQNSANSGGGDMYMGYQVNCNGADFKDTGELALHWDVYDFTSAYKSGETLTIKLKNSRNWTVNFVNCDVVIYKNEVIFKNYPCLSGDMLSFDLPSGKYTAELSVTYPGLEQTSPMNITLTITKAAPKIEVSAFDATYPGKVIVNVKSDVSGEYIVKVANQSQNVNIEANAAKNVTFAGLNINEKGYIINVTPGNDNYVGFNDSEIVKVKKALAKLTAGAVTATYNLNKDLVITLTGINGNPLGNVDVTVNLNTPKTFTTDRNGQIKVSTKGLSPGSYIVKITFKGNSIYDKSTKDVPVTVKKAKAKITAKKKTFKKSTKIKKYTITLKSGKKAIKKAKVTLKVKGKTYKAKTDSKGKATFKIKKLNNKKVYKAGVEFKGNEYYKKTSKTVKITVK